MAAPIVEILRDRLWWSPEGSSARASKTVGAKVVAAEELCDFEYSVPHYASAAVGCTFGPLSLDRVFCFCSELHRSMERFNKLVLTYPPDEIQTHSNAAVFIGAYLVLWLDWSSSDVAQALGTRHANLTFPCSWTSEDTMEPKRVLRARDCWEGLEHAVSNGWLDPLEFKDPSALASLIFNYRKMAYQFDGSWLVPGLIFVCSDPVSTALDPNPSTFTQIFPEDDENSSEESTQASTPRLMAGAKLPGFTDSKQSEDADSTPDPSHAGCHSLLQDDTESVETVCKPYSSEETDTRFQFGKAPDFASMLKELGVTLVVRTNFLTEHGLARSYDSEKLKAFGFDHLSMPFPDVQGAVPTTSKIEALVGRCNDYLDGSQGAIAVHCKGGFGRSICCASKLISLRYPIPGRALLGWLRLVRPGAVNSPSQEEFISSLNSRSSATRSIDEDYGGAQPKCGCEVM